MKVSKIFSLLFVILTLQLQAQNYQWAKNIGTDLGAGIYPSNIAVDQNGNVFVAGRFDGTVDFDPGAGLVQVTSAGSTDIFFSKFDANGNFLWAKTIGSSMSEICWAMKLDALGNIIIAGYYGDVTDFDPGNGTSNLSCNGSEDCFIATYTNDGNYVWANGFGAQGLDQISKMDIDGTGNIYVAGFFQGIVDFDPGSGSSELTALNVGPTGYNLFFAKYSSNGNYFWANQIPTSSTQICIATDNAGNAFVAGEFSNTNSNPIDFDPGNGSANLLATGAGDIFFSRYDAAGNYVYAYAMGGTSFQADLDKATDVDVDNNGNVYLCGIFGSTTDFDPGTGNVSFTSVGSGDMFFAKYNFNGNYLWAHSFQSDDYAALNIHLDANNDVLISGSFYGTTDFDPGSGMAELISNGNQDLFFAKYDNNGNYLSAAGTGFIYGDDITSDITTDNAGNIYVTGTFVDSADFDMTASNAVLHSAVSFGQDLFLAKYTSGPVSIEIYNSENATLKVSPNPTDGIINVKISNETGCYYFITNLIGEVIKKGILTNGYYRIDMRENQKGIYFLNMEGQVAKIIIK